MEPLGELDLLMAAAWPPALIEQRDGWLFRFTSGVTRRANSVLVVGQPGDLPATVTAAELFYRHHEAEPIFLLSDASAPASVAPFLESRGFGASASTWMLWTTTAEVLSALPGADQWTVEVSPEPTDAWFDTYWTVESTRRTRASDASIVREELLKPDGPAVFVSLGAGDEVFSVGQIVTGDGWACVQCLATLPSARRRGAGAQLLRHLAAEAEVGGALRIFAAVMADNEASLGLFQRASFRRSHRYAYYSR